MRLRRLTLANYCQFENFDVEFAPGLIALVGPNGSGKSNIVSAIEYAITGKHPSAGVLADNRRKGSPKTAVSSVTLEFEHQSQVYRIVRYIGSRKAELYLPNTDKPLIGEREVTGTVLGLVDLPDTVLREVTFAKQRELLSLLDADDTARLDTLAKLFSVTQGELLYKTLGSAKAIVPTPQEDPLAAVVTAEAELAARQSAYVTIEQELSAMPAELSEVRDRTRSTLAALETSRAASHAISQAIHQLPQVEQQLVAQLEKVSQLSARQGEIDKRCRDLEIAHESADSMLRLYNEQLQSVRRHNQDVDAYLLAVQRLSVHVIPPNRTADRDAAAALVTEARTQSQRLSKMLATLLEARDTGTAVCPTCVRPFADLSELTALIERLQNEFVQWRATSDAAQTQLDALNTAVAACLQATVTAADLQSAVTVSRAVLNGQEEKRSEPRQPAEAIAYNPQLLATAKKELEDVTQAVTTAKAELAALEQQRTALQYTASCPVPGVVKLPEGTSESQLVAFAAQLEQELVKQQRLRTDLAVEAQRVSTAEQALQRAKQQAVVAKRWLALQEELTAVREVYHKKAAPADVIQGSMQATVPLINSLLAAFQSQFVVQVREDLRYDAIFPNQVVTPDYLLSGGQSVLLMIAFRFAMYYIRASRLGFMFLDEPTTFLDETHIAGFEPVLERLRSMTADMALQCFVATHEKSLMPCFDQVIDLS